MGRGKEMVEELCEGGEREMELQSEIRNGELIEVLSRIWKDGIITS